MISRPPLPSCMAVMWVLLISVNIFMVYLYIRYLFIDDSVVLLRQRHQRFHPYLDNKEHSHEDMIMEEFYVYDKPPKEPDPVIVGGKIKESLKHTSYIFAVQSDNWATLSKSWPVCLSTEASADRLFWVGELIKTWAGPISIAVFVPDSDYTIALKMIEMMRSCNENIRQRVSFHMTYPIDLPPRSHDVKKMWSLNYNNCDLFEYYNEGLVFEMNGTVQNREYLTDKIYPQNVLRNIARNGCDSEYVFMPDIDKVLVTEMSYQMKRFFERSDTKLCKKCAFIIPIYEIHSEAPGNPTNKFDLRIYLKRKWARRFRAKTFKSIQMNSQLGRWENFDSQKYERKEMIVIDDSLKTPINGSLKVLYDIDTWANFWEPVYVAENIEVPIFDERFVGKSYSRSSQVYEMCAAGFRWRMLSEAFLCHRGFQNKKFMSLWTEMDNGAIVYQKFQQEMQQKYGMPAQNGQQIPARDSGQKIRKRKKKQKHENKRRSKNRN